MSNLQPWEQLPMYTISDELAPEIDRLGLTDHLTRLRRDGFTVIPVDRDLTDRVRQAVRRLVTDHSEADGTFDRTCGQPVGADPAIDEAVTHPVVLALAEYMCGRGCTLSAVLATERLQGDGYLPLHADQAFLPAPFPEHNVSMTACWITDDFRQETGATMVVPGTQRLRRPPTPDEMVAAEGTIPIESAAGAVAIWDGAVWHGSYPRQVTGERVVLHVTYARLAYRTFHDFGYLDKDYRVSASPTMRRLLGEHLAFGTNGPNQHLDLAKFVAMNGDVVR